MLRAWGGRAWVGGWGRRRMGPNWGIGGLGKRKGLLEAEGDEEGREGLNQHYFLDARKRINDIR
jgi:hypothetical protein